ncbi:MAG: cation-translocating P-type ATPase [Alphaproteobacteria bacterium]
MSNDVQESARKPYHALGVGEVIGRLDVDPERGLTTDEVVRRRKRYGENRLAEDAGAKPLALLLRQFTDLMIVVLLVAAVVAGLIGEAIDAIAILTIVMLNGIIGFIQEYRAERVLRALQELSAPHVQVQREGRSEQVAEAGLVPGDIVLLEAGNVVPADLRVIETANLTVDEAALTGESVPVLKDAEAAIPVDTLVSDRTTMAHKGTHVTSGHARCIAVATGAQTELGHIAKLMRERERPMTPLQKRLASFSRRLSAAVLAICAVVFVAGLLRGEAPLLMLLTAVSLAVAAIPEALPAVVTIGLALGAKRITGHNAVVRRLPAVETLGSVTIICCDKTGTLTQNTMRAESFRTPQALANELPGAGEADGCWHALGRAMALNNDAKADAAGVIRGDPTEVAILEAARDAGFAREALEENWARTGEISFDSRRRRMTTLHRRPDGVLAIVKGAPEAILPLSRDQRAGDGTKPLDSEAFLKIAEEAARSGYRLLAFAERKLDQPPPSPKAEDVERDLTFLGLVALADPPRPRVEQALASCSTAGIAVAMITGDHPATAKSIARRLGIVTDDGVLTGRDLQDLSEEKRSEAVSQTRVYARVSPEQKLDIVTALQRRGQFVAMTGDGVNDAPALKQADIGVAMGQKGTDVAREAADAVLLDDDFATIVAAVEEGRRIYDNIRKFIKYTMTSNSGEVWTIFLAPFFGLPLPLLPIQILWINLVTDGLPGLALSVEPQERNVMDRPPRPPNENVFAHGMWQHMIWAGLLIGGLSLGSQAWAYHNGSENWQTVVFTVLTLSQLVHAMAIRSERESLFTIGWFSNPSLFGAVVLTLGLQMAVVYVDPLHVVFKTGDLTLEELLVCLVVPWVVLPAVEIEKWLFRRGLIYQGPRRHQKSRTRRPRGY